MPAASSSTRRRWSGRAWMISPMRPWWTKAGDREPVEASANRTLTSRARTSRPLTRKTEPCSRMMRRDTSSASASLNADGALRSLLSTMTLTSAWLRAGRPVLPEKITSSISDARMALYDASPMTQRTASTRLDLPQPFGPTTPVRPGSISKSVGSTKDLKPIKRSRVSFIRVLFPFLRRGDERNRRRLMPLGLSRGCRIGAENKSSGLSAQQSRGVIQTFRPPIPGGTSRGAGRRPPAKSKKPYPSLR